MTDWVPKEEEVGILKEILHYQVEPSCGYMWEDRELTVDPIVRAPGNLLVVEVELTLGPRAATLRRGILLPEEEVVDMEKIMKEIWGF